MSMEPCASPPAMAKRRNIGMSWSGADPRPKSWPTWWTPQLPPIKQSPSPSPWRTGHLQTRPWRICHWTRPWRSVCEDIHSLLEMNIVVKSMPEEYGESVSIEWDDLGAYADSLLGDVQLTSSLPPQHDPNGGQRVVEHHVRLYHRPWWFVED
jgi:hypothetical protein